MSTLESASNYTLHFTKTHGLQTWPLITTTPRLSHVPTHQITDYTHLDSYNHITVTGQKDFQFSPSLQSICCVILYQSIPSLWITDYLPGFDLVLVILFLILPSLVYVVCSLLSPMPDYWFFLLDYISVLFATSSINIEGPHLHPYLLPDRILHISMDVAGNDEWCHALATQGCFIREQQQINMLTSQHWAISPATPVPPPAASPSASPLIACPEKYTRSPAGCKGFIL